MNTRSSAINIKKTDPLPSSSSNASFESRFPGVTLTGSQKLVFLTIDVIVTSNYLSEIF
jgi:hypothetical protein